MQSHKHMHLESLNLTLNLQPSKGDEWEEICLAQKDVKMIKMSREIPKSQPPTIYKGPQRIEPLGSSLCLPQGDRTRRSIWPDIASASGHYVPSPRMAAMCLSLNLARTISTVTRMVSALSTPWPDASTPSTWGYSMWRPVISREGFSAWDHDQTRQVRGDLTCPSVRSRTTTMRLRDKMTSAYVRSRRMQALRVRFTVSARHKRWPDAIVSDQAALGVKPSPLALCAPLPTTDRTLTPAFDHSQRPVDEHRLLFIF
jgi:hypothetical protein